ncbi:WXG100 family type VII secretion target [Streptomyces sp. TRM70350]|uniref:WXG100 family type VII secretion target n=1 Tax=Streptomyces sp. TRM70350 TaxID=2856165 RepID=UPI001C4856A7|nr:hypothetical protein [Streptomyces sp. TRM70350]MBV7698097.1 hypothetical protein [Streptomyces sp. TRM70350]
MTDEHKVDLDRVRQQNSFADIARSVEDPQDGGLLTRLVNASLHAVVGATPAGQAVHRSTDFGATNLGLNQLIDLVERTNPEDLESSGKALWDARDAIKAAAKELDGHIGNVRWVGESGVAFRRWGRSLVVSTEDLSEFAGAAGDQITAAAEGLASVRKAMPSRDTQPDRKRPEHFTEAEKAADKEEYADAVRVEKDRQEAINQMNRLASYYAVSGQQLEALPVPKFESMPDVGVPQPAKYWAGPDGTASERSQGAASWTVADAQASAQSAGQVRVPGTGETPVQSTGITGRATYPDEPVGTNINSVDTLPPNTTTPVTGNTPPVTGTPPTNGGQPSMFGGGHRPPIPKDLSGKTTGGAGGLRTPASAQGRAGMTGASSSSSGRSAGQGPLNQMGRATSTGQPVARGTASGSRSFSVGPGVTGGTPRASGTAAPRAAGGPSTGAGRDNGVAGGRPTTAGGTPAKSGPRIPQGTVIGAGPTANARPTTGRPGQRGVFGVPESGVRSGTSGNVSRGSSGRPEAVTGSPASRISAAGAERNGMTRGGAGLVRGPGGQGEPREVRNAEGSPRTGHSVEDEEPHLPNKPRRDVPPVVN